MFLNLLFANYIVTPILVCVISMDKDNIYKISLFNVLYMLMMWILMLLIDDWHYKPKSIIILGFSSLLFYKLAILSLALPSSWLFFYKYIV